MTTSVRRSSRIQTKEDTSGYQEADSDFDESEQSNEDASDDEYVASSNKRGKKAQKSKNTRNKRAKVSKISDGFEENGLYKALSKPEVSTYEIALEWVESFIEDEQDAKNDAFTSVFNLLLRCCGCTSLAQPHDLVNLDSAAETVGEITIMFENQRVHEYPFISNNKTLKFFKTNVLEFFENVIEVAHEKGVLYRDVEEREDEDALLSSSLMTQILTWFSALSSCTVRPFRYISTVIILAIQSKLCDVLVKITSALEKQQRQLTNAKTNTKSKRNKSAHQRKIDTITKGIQIYHNQKETILEYFTDIVETIFIHRYRDVDPSIRSECLKSLGYWMMGYPDHFFQSSFLRYFGWLLSDPSEHVRAEVARVLLKLYKNSNQNGQNMGIGFRQFTERFKKQLINMSWKDKDFSVRFHLVAVLCELLRAGFLDELDIQEIVSSVFYTLEYGSGSGVANESKLKTELCKFISLANNEEVESQLEKFTIFMDNYESPQFGDEPGKLSLRDCLQVQSLIKLLRSAYKVYTEGISQRIDLINSPLKKSEFPVSSLFKVLYSLPSYSSSWEFLIRYFLYDLSSISFVHRADKTAEENIEVSELKSLLELNSDEDKLYLLKFIHGAIIAIFDKKSARKANQDENENDPHNVLTKLGNYLPPLSKISSQSVDQFYVFLQIWNVLIRISNGTDNICNVFENLGQESIYNEIIERTISFYRDYEAAEEPESDSPIIQVYDEFFERLLSEYDDVSAASNVVNQGNNTSAHLSTIDNSSASVLNDAIRLQIQNLLQDLASETRNALSSTHAADSVMIDEITDDDLQDQKIICNTLIEVSKPLSKLAQIGNFININEYIADGGASTSIIDLITIRILNKLDVKPLYSSWPNNFLRIIDKFMKSFKSVLDILIISTCWKIDFLIHLSSGEAQSNYDIESTFDDIATALSQLQNLLSSFDHAMHVINENPSSCGQTSHQNVVKLIKEFGQLKTLFGAKLIDLLVSLRVFFIKFRSNNSFRKFDEFFQDREGAGKYLSNLIPSDLQHLLLNIFLQKEAKLASLIEVHLDRTDAEDVNFEDLIHEDEHLDADHQEKSGFDSDNEEVSDEEDEQNSRLDDLETQKRIKEFKAKQEKSRNIWEAEKDLCVFTVKLFSLANTGMVDDSMTNRLKLNGIKIGGLYNNILQQNEGAGNASMPPRPSDDTNLASKSKSAGRQIDSSSSTQKQDTPDVTSVSQGEKEVEAFTETEA